MRQQITELKATKTKRNQAEDVLKESEANYHAIFDAANDAIFVHDTKTGAIIDVNQKMCEMYGYAREEARHLNVEALSVGEPPYAQENALLLMKKAAEGEPQLFEWKAKDKNGRLFWVEVNLKRVVIGGKDCLLAIVRDITERKQAEEKLSIAHQQLLDIIEFLPDATFVIDHNKKVIAWNRAIEEMTGVRKEDIIGKGNYAYAVPFYGKPMPMLVDLIFSDNKETELQYKYIKRKESTLFAEVFSPSAFDGKGAFMWGKASPLFDSHGNLVGAIESIRDITEHKRMEDELKKHRDHLEYQVKMRTYELKTANAELQRKLNELKQAEEALRESEQRYRQLVELSPEMIAVHSEGRFVFSNTAGARLLGAASPEEIIGKPIMDIVHSNYREIVKERIGQMQEERKAVPLMEQKLIRLDGTVIDVEVAGVPLTFQGKPAVQIVIHDITERKRAEQALHAAQQQLMNIIEFLPDATFVIDRDKKVIAWNRAMEEMSGVPKEDIIGKGDNVYTVPFYGKRRLHLIDLIFSDDREPELLYDYVKRKGSTIFAEVFSPLVFEGKGAFLLGKASPLFDSDGNLAGAIESIRDITEHKQAEEALRLSEERFSKAFNASPNPIAITTFKDGRYIDVNDSYIRITGYSHEEIIGHTTTELILWATLEDRAKIIQILNEQGVFRNIEISFRTKSGEERVGLFSAEIIDLNGEQCILSEVNDITERKQLEQEVARLDRLNLIGEMAAGIAHEIRNPMTTVRGFLQMLGHKKECMQYKENFALMIEELDRANSIITEFLSLAKNRVVDLKEQNLNFIVKVLFPLIQADAMVYDKYVQVELGDIPDLLLDEKEIRQLILNLARNGLEAMSPGENLTIRTFTNGEEVVLSVQDQGKGIVPELLDKICTPFFTTKDQGTGLGLSICYSIVVRHNATIKVKTGPTGTTFFVRFKQ